MVSVELGLKQNLYKVADKLSVLKFMRYLQKIKTSSVGLLKFAKNVSKIENKILELEKKVDDKIFDIKNSFEIYRVLSRNEWANTTNSKQLLLYGHGSMAEEFIYASKRYGFDPIGIYHEMMTAESGIKNIQFFGKDDFIIVAKSLKIPIVITNLSPDHGKFSQDILYIRESLNLDNHLLHPVFLCDYYKSIQPRYHLIGFPGSGNMVFQNIMQCIFNVKKNKSKEPDVDILHKFMEQNALWYWHSLIYNLEHLCKNEKPFTSVSAPRYIRTGSFCICVNVMDFNITFDGLPLRSYMWANLWSGDHSPPTLESINFFQNQGFSIIQIIRNPLDVIVSVAAKLDKNNPRSILGDEEWFTEILMQIVRYYSFVIENMDKIHVVSYEDLLADPLTTIRNFSTALGGELSHSECINIWESINGKKLSSFWKPGVEKWKKYIPGKYKTQLYESGLIKVAQKLGYKIDLEDLIEEKNEKTLTESLYLLAAIDATDYRNNIGKKITFKHPRIKAEYISDTGIHVSCDIADFEKISAFVDSRLNRDMIAASRLEPWPEAAEMSLYFAKGRN